MPLVMERGDCILKVSTQRQHRSGHGLGAQRATMERVAANESLTIQAEYVEAESGKGSDVLDRRPQLAAALAAAKAAKAAKCSVVVAKLDRLSRDVAFVAGLMAQRVPFIVARLGSGCRSIHVAPLCGAGREGAAAHIGPYPVSAGGQESDRGRFGKSAQSGPSRRPGPNCLDRECRR